MTAMISGLLCFHTCFPGVTPVIHASNVTAISMITERKNGCLARKDENT